MLRKSRYALIALSVLTFILVGTSVIFSQGADYLQATASMLPAGVYVDRMVTSVEPIQRFRFASTTNYTTVTVVASDVMPHIRVSDQNGNVVGRAERPASVMTLCLKPETIPSTAIFTVEVENSVIQGQVYRISRTETPSGCLLPTISFDGTGGGLTSNGSGGNGTSTTVSTNDDDGNNDNDNNGNNDNDNDNDNNGNGNDNDNDNNGNGNDNDDDDGGTDPTGDSCRDDDATIYVNLIGICANVSLPIVDGNLITILGPDGLLDLDLDLDLDGTVFVGDLVDLDLDLDGIVDTDDALRILLDLDLDAEVGDVVDADVDLEVGVNLNGNDPLITITTGNATAVPGTGGGGSDTGTGAVLEIIPTVVQIVPTVVAPVSTVVQVVPTVVQIVPTVVQAVPTIIAPVSTAIPIVPTVVQVIPTVIAPVNTLIPILPTLIGGLGLP